MNIHKLITQLISWIIEWVIMTFYIVVLLMISINIFVIAEFALAESPEKHSYVISTLNPLLLFEWKYGAFSLAAFMFLATMANMIAQQITGIDFREEIYERRSAIFIAICQCNIVIGILVGIQVQHLVPALIIALFGCITGGVIHILLTVHKAARVLKQQKWG